MSEQIEIKVVSLGGINQLTVDAGTTVEQLRSKASLTSSVKIVNEAGDILKDNDVVTESCNLFISVPKQNA